MNRRRRLFVLPNLDTITNALVLVRLGQELGTDSQLARAVAGLIEALIQSLGGIGR